MDTTRLRHSDAPRQRRRKIVSLFHGVPWFDLCHKHILYFGTLSQTNPNPTPVAHLEGRSVNKNRNNMLVRSLDPPQEVTLSARTRISPVCTTVPQNAARTGSQKKGKRSPDSHRHARVRAFTAPRRRLAWGHTHIHARARSPVSGSSTSPASSPAARAMTRITAAAAAGNDAAPLRARGARSHMVAALAAAVPGAQRGGGAQTAVRCPARDPAPRGPARARHSNEPKQHTVLPREPPHPPQHRTFT